jgi:hypothetical protein
MEWLAENWVTVSAVIELVILAILGKWALVKAKAVTLLVENGEGPVNTAYRKRVRKATEKAQASVRDTIKNAAAKSDPNPEKKPEHKGKAFLKLVGRTVLETAATTASPLGRVLRLLGNRSR